MGTHDLIAAKLRKLFDEVAQQPIPERFVELLHELEEKDAGQEAAKHGKSD